MDRIGERYAEGRERITDLARSMGPADAGVTVPACPDWTVQDLFAHLAGTCADALSGNLEGATTAAWANGHARQRRQRSMEELLEEWTRCARPLEAASDRMPPDLARLWVLDLTAHEHDVRGALGRPGARDSGGMLLAVDCLLTDGLHPRLVDMGLGPVDVHTEAGSWTVGGLPGASPSHSVAKLSSSLFELFRALTGRRSPAQIARLGWTGDPGPFLPTFEFGTFTTRSDDLVE